MLLFGLMLCSIMLFGGGVICVKVSFILCEGLFCVMIGVLVFCMFGIICFICGFCFVWVVIVGLVLISGCVVGVVCVMKEGNVFIFIVIV